MKTNSCIAVLCTMCAFCCSRSAVTQSASKQATPQLFAPDVVSTPDFEFDTSFTPDGKTVFFSKGDPAYNRITVVASRLKGGRWTRPGVASFSGVWKDTDAHVTPDGRRIYFVSNRPTDGGSTPRKDYDLWYVDAQPDHTCGSPHHLEGPINTTGNEAFPSTSLDGTMYFEASRPDHPGTHIYRSRFVDGRYIEPVLLSFSGKPNDINPVVASDGSFMIFVSRDRGGQGSSDLFVSFPNQDDTWTEPVNLGPLINSKFAETAPGLSPDNHWLYFSSNRMEEPLVRSTPASYQQLEKELHSIQNGLLNIYEIDLGDIQRLKRR